MQGPGRQAPATVTGHPAGGLRLRAGLRRRGAATATRSTRDQHAHLARSRAPFGSRHSRSHFQVWSGTDVGPTQATETVTSGSTSRHRGRSRVHGHRQLHRQRHDRPARRTSRPTERRDVGARRPRARSTTTRSTLPPAGTRLQVHLTNLHADFDLALYSSAVDDRADRRHEAAPPLQDGTVADQSLNLQGGQNAQLTPAALQDVPDPGHPGRPGLGEPRHGRRGRRHGLAWLRLRVRRRLRLQRRVQPAAVHAAREDAQAPPALTCPRAPFPRRRPGHRRHSADDRIAARQPEHADPRQREAHRRHIRHRAAETNVIDVAHPPRRLRHVARRQRRGHPGRRVSGAQAQYNAWDAEPVQRRCGEQRREHDRERGRRREGGAAEPQVRRLRRRRRPDPVLPDPRPVADRERDRLRRHSSARTSTSARSPRRPADRQPVPRHAADPGERPPALRPRPRRRASRRDAQTEIIDASRGSRPRAASSPRSTAFVSGYDFVTDGSQRVQTRSRMRSSAPATPLADQQHLVEDRPAESARRLPGGRPRRDQRLERPLRQPPGARGERRPVEPDHDGRPDGARMRFSGGIFFTMGCHAGFQTTDAIVGATAPDKLDWAQNVRTRTEPVSSATPASVSATPTASRSRKS